jgi:MoaA/NifB/PqqE/SkfB family radical SAM enzyme
MLEDIGFYTLSDERACNVSWSSDLQRCELILTDRCNFKCAYCRGIVTNLRGDLGLGEAKHIVDLWANDNLHNIRFSGGEPTIWPRLIELVEYTKSKPSIEHIAISTNGSASEKLYNSLIDAGVNDFSISLDACCAMDADMMAGTNSRFEHISAIIKLLSYKTYVSVGVVLDKRNLASLSGIIDYATSLGVSDIRIIPSAQYNKMPMVEKETKFSILQYRLNNMKHGKSVRGLVSGDCGQCHLIKDDMVILHGKHFPCIIYMREQGNAIGSIENKSIEEIRAERKEWFLHHDSFDDVICSRNCLDVCIDYNNRVKELQVT